MSSPRAPPTPAPAAAQHPAAAPPRPNSDVAASSTTPPFPIRPAHSTATPSPSLPATAASTSRPGSSLSPSPSPSALDRLQHDAPRKLARNVSPGLLARMKFLNQPADAPKPQAPVLPQHVGRISESKIRELDDFHRDRTVRIERRGTTWSRSSSQVGTPRLIAQLTGESQISVPTLAMDQSPPPGFESDRSSFVSTSDRVLPSDSEAGDHLAEDTQKYRLPDITKTKSLSQSIAETTPTEDLTRPPTPPPKDTPPLPPAEEVSVLDSNNGIDVEAYFERRHFSRATSIYTLSRASFTNQIQQLTSIKLPPPDSLSSEIAALPNATAAGRALHSAANQIKLWMSKASEVLNGLDAEDDVEWAAAAGREGLEEVDAAIGKFEGLVTVYIIAIEDLQSRPDIASLPLKDQTTLVSQMEDVVNGWTKIKQTLKGIKAQVEIAMEWEELWNTVLGEIGFEIENLSRLVFEMEERRHRAISDSVAESAEKFDIADLETIVEETPRQARAQNNRFSVPAMSVLSPISPIPQIEQENSRLLALFAKLQPLRASLDFLPMRLSSFQMRANRIFPSACEELNRRKEVLEKQEKKLESDADALREELGEDKWVHSFRQAGSKAIAMYDSLMKSIQRLRQAINEGDDEKLGSRISTYKDKREHYPPSMRRVLELIDIEMKNRSTVNGEILRIQQDVRQKVSDLELETKEVDMILGELNTTRTLRDSVSTVLSARTEASLTGSALDTPNSSPASSVIMSRKSGEYVTPVGKKSRQPSSSSTQSSVPTNRRYSGLPTSTHNLPRKSLTTSRLETISAPRTMSSTATPARSSRSITPGSDTPANKPRWNSSTNMRDTMVGHNFKPLSVTTPSPYRKDATPVRTLRSTSGQSSIPVRSPLGRSTLSPPTVTTRSVSATPGQASARRPLASPMQAPSTPARGSFPGQSTPGSHSKLSAGTPGSGRRSAINEEEGESTATEESPIVRRTRPASAMNSRRVSLLPTPKQRTSSGSGMSSLTTGIGATPGRSASRLNHADEGRKSRAGAPGNGRTSQLNGRTSQLNGRTSQLDGRKSSLEDRPKWR